MTQQAELMKKIEKLPPQYFREAIDFVGYLQQKAQTETAANSVCAQNNVIEQEEPPKGRVFGCAKGQFKIADDFDAPLEDFKDYM